MALVHVEAFDENALERAEKLAEQLGVPCIGIRGAADGKTVAEGKTVVDSKAIDGKQKPPNGVKLIVGANGLALGFLDKSKGKPYFVDFLSTTWKARFQVPLAKSHIFRRALGVRDEPLTVVDATAGFGQDAMLAASLGCSVIAVERSPVIAALLRDGIERAVREDEYMKAKLSTLALQQMDSIEYLKSLSPDRLPDVVYIDPMFDKPKKTAKSPKEMQLVQELLEPAKPDDEEKLLAAALSVARKRVVVKRPLKARAVKSAPSHSFKGQSIRYDVYVKG